MSLASRASWAQPTSPTSSTSNSKEVTIPKFAPAPRTAQNSSGFSVALTRVDSAVGQHHRGGAEMIDGQAVLAGQPADAAGGGQPADPDPAVVARS